MNSTTKREATLRPHTDSHSRRAANLRRLNDELLDQIRSARILARFGDAAQRTSALERISKLQPMLAELRQVAA